MAFKGASDKRQAALSRVLPKFLGDGEVSEPTLSEYRENLILKRKSLEARKAATEDKAESKLLGQELLQVCNTLGEVNTALKRYRFKERDISNLILHIIRRDVPVAQYKMWLEKAKRVETMRQALPAEAIDALIGGGQPDDPDKIEALFNNWNQTKTNVIEKESNHGT